MPTLRVAIVEDDLIVRDISQAGLARAGHEVVACDSGFDVHRRCVEEGERFDVIVMDIVMPGISGLEVAAAIAGQPQAGDTRFVFISALPRALEEARNAYGDAAVFLPKPYRQDDLVQAVLAARSLPAGGKT